MSTRPVLIIGPPRSGTTLLATMLNAHPRIFVAHEAKVFVKLLPRSRSYGSALSVDTAGGILRDLETNELLSYAPLPTPGQVSGRMSERTIPALIRSLFELLAEREGKARWGEKTAVAYRQLDAIRAAYPDALLMGMDRDPLQIASSYQKTIPKWGALGGLTNWIDYRRALARQVSAFPFHVVSYDNLTSSPEEELRRVCAYIGEEFHPAMLDFHRTERAARLKGSREFGGVARGLFRPAPPDDRLRRGFQGRMVNMLLAAGSAARPGWRERVLRAGLFVRALLWDLRQPEFRRRLQRIIDHRRRAWQAAHR
jgi:hypothetical protein